MSLTRSLFTILLLVLSNTFMTLAWYGHLKFHHLPLLRKVGLGGTILLSWGIALIEYALMVPANRLGSKVTGGPFDLWQLKVIQEAISVSVFTVLAITFFKMDSLRPNHLIGFVLLVGAVYFFFKR